MTASSSQPPTPLEVQRGNYLISTDSARIDLDVIYGYLSRSYWATGRPREVVARSLQGSLCFGLYHGASQVGFARVVTDYTTFAWLCDVFVLKEHRGKGLAVWLIGVVVGHPELQGLRRFLLATRDAHGLYKRHGFTPLAAPERWMERVAVLPPPTPIAEAPPPGEEISS